VRELHTLPSGHHRGRAEASYRAVVQGLWALPAATEALVEGRARIQGASDLLHKKNQRLVQGTCLHKDMARQAKQAPGPAVESRRMPKGTHVEIEWRLLAQGVAVATVHAVSTRRTFLVQGLILLSENEFANNSVCFCI